MWTVSCRKEYTVGGIKFDTGPVREDVETYDKYLFISKKFRTMVIITYFSIFCFSLSMKCEFNFQVLATGEELQELEHSEFYSDGPTIAVGSLLNQLRIVQVYSGGLYLLDAGIAFLTGLFYSHRLF